MNHFVTLNLYIVSILRLLIACSSLKWSLFVIFFFWHIHCSDVCNPFLWLYINSLFHLFFQNKHFFCLAFSFYPLGFLLQNSIWVPNPIEFCIPRLNILWSPPYSFSWFGIHQGWWWFRRMCSIFNIRGFLWCLFLGFISVASPFPPIVSPNYTSYPDHIFKLENKNTQNFIQKINPN